VFVGKGEDGHTSIVELDNKEDPRFDAFAPMLEGLTGLLTEDDIEEIAADLEPNTSALVIMFERETIRPESLEMLNAEIEAAELSA
jgi:hypothetical protein